MPRALGSLLAAALMVAPVSTARAHPHEFVDVALTLGFDTTGMLRDIVVEWRYDPFTSMLILADLGLNPAAEALSEAEVGELRGFDLNWVEGFNGDLWPEYDDVPVALGAPIDGGVRLDDGQIVSRHVRALIAPLDPTVAALTLAVYDPEYYVAYTLAELGIEGRDDCRVARRAPDLGAAQAQLDAAQDMLDAALEGDVEGPLPSVGRDFAEVVTLNCAAG